jgi:PKD repeat protein
VKRALVLLATFTSGLGPLAATDDEPSRQPGAGPVAAPAADVEAGAAPLRVCFDASRSHHPEERPLAFWWDFGDGRGATAEPRPCHEYVQPGLYAATLTVTDDRGLEDSRAFLVSVREGP